MTRSDPIAPEDAANPSRSEAASVREDLRAALMTLEEAREEFSVWLGDSKRRRPSGPDPEIAAEPRMPQEPANGPAGPPLKRFSAPDRPAPPRTAPEPRPEPAQAGTPPPPFGDAALEQAEAEARAYLEQAKNRVDSLVRTMLGAVEEQAWALQCEAEQGIRNRWQQVETAADDYLSEARTVADALVEQRRRRIAELSDSIREGAERVTRRLEDADRVRAQFDRLVESLSLAADRVAKQIEAESRAAAEARRRP